MSQQVYPSDPLTKYNLGLLYFAFERFDKSLGLFQTVETILPRHADIQFAKAFCQDLVSREDDVDRYLDLVAEFPHVQQAYHHLVLLYLKSGNHQAAEKLLELFVSLFNDFEGRGLLMLWVALLYISARGSDHLALYQRRLESVRDDPLVADLFVLNKAVANINFNTNIEEAEFMLENLYDETGNRHVKLVAGINLLVLLETRGQPRFRLTFLRRLIEDFRGYLDCHEFQKQYQRLRAEMFDADPDFLFKVEYADAKAAQPPASHAAALLFFPARPLHHSLGSVQPAVGSSLPSPKGPEASVEMVAKPFACGDDPAELAEVVEDLYFRIAYEAIEETMDPHLREKDMKSLHALPEHVSRPSTPLRPASVSDTSLSECTDAELLFKRALLFLERNDVEGLKRVLLQLHRVDPRFKKELVTFSLGELTRPDLLRRGHLRRRPALPPPQLRGRTQ